MKLKYKYFAIDFDNTIAIDNHPNIGELIPGAIETINKIKNLNGQICIWTCRTGSQARLVKKFLFENNIPYDKFNENFDEHIEEYGGDCRKIYADVYIDDKCLLWQVGNNKIVNWETINKLIFEEE